MPATQASKVTADFIAPVRIVDVIGDFRKGGNSNCLQKEVLIPTKKAFEVGGANSHLYKQRKGGPAFVDYDPKEIKILHGWARRRYY